VCGVGLGSPHLDAFELEHAGLARPLNWKWRLKVKKILIGSAVAGAALLAAVTGSFAQGAFNGPQYPYTANVEQPGTFGQAYGQASAPTPRYYGAAVAQQRQTVRSRNQVAPSVVGEPAPGQQPE
jgi:hypothetical protein